MGQGTRCETPTVTVIIPAYNAADTIRSAVDSVLSQSLKDLELVVVDDGSRDSTDEILQRVSEMDGRIRVLRKENGGVSSARNLGLAEARGKWIAFLDADDRMASDYLQSLLVAVEPGVDMVIAGATTEREGKRQTLANQDEGLLDRGEIRNLEMQILDEESHGGNPCCIYILGCICSKLFKKSLLHNIRFDERIGMREDAAFNLEALSRAHRVAVSKNCGYLYLSTGESASLRFHPNFNAEVDAFLGDCRSIWVRDGLPMTSYHRGVLYSYMSWLKLYVLHQQNGFVGAYRNELIERSFSEARWRDSFEALSDQKLDMRYTLLRLAYMHQSVHLVKLLKKANDVKKRLA